MHDPRPQAVEPVVALLVLPDLQEFPVREELLVEPLVHAEELGGATERCEVDTDLRDVSEQPADLQVPQLRKNAHRPSTFAGSSVHAHVMEPIATLATSPPT